MMNNGDSSGRQRRPPGRGRASGRGRGRGRGGSKRKEQQKTAGGRGRENRRGGRATDDTSVRSSAGPAGRGIPKHQQPPRQPETAPVAPSKTNGEKGASSHTVSEAQRIHYTKLLMNLRENDDVNQLEFPPTLTNTERKFVHELSAQLGLVSKSSGKGENRRINVRKRNEKVKSTEDEEGVMPTLRVGRRGVEALRRHLQRFPPTHAEKLESHETGSAVLEALMQHSDDDNGGADTSLATTLDQLGLGVDKEAPMKADAYVKPVDLERRRQAHAAAQERKQRHSQYRAMQRVRSQLPAFAHQDEIVAAVRDHPVTIISGDTGCGKSTQVPQFLLDANDTASIIVTQPRRISAIAVAERVAQEQCLEPVGGIIGYQVRLESAASKSTQLLFLTPGVLLRKLQSSPTLHEYTHIVIDEIHERDRYTEFLLITLRDLLPQRSDLRVILMSATLQIDRLLEYWQMFPMAHVQMQGRTFPVQAFFLEQALQMTGYLNDVLGNHAVEDAELDAALAALTNTTNDADPFLVDVPDFADASSVVLTCVMCGRTGFADAIELGSHVALCDGGANEDMEALEERVRGMDSTDHVRHVTPQNADLLGIQDQFEDADEGAKWDGKSPFEIASKNPTGMTLTEEELLNQYQAMHDDEQIDNPLLIEILRFIVKASYGDGAILVFFPGWQEISEFTLWLEGTAPFRDTSKYLILPLHSSIPSKDQRKVLQRPPRGVRKIILSTNIAETSLTIDDVAFVVDTGRAKEKNYDPHLKTSTLQGTWVSRASAKQRRGRAGRTKAGVCFHLFSSRRHASMREFVDSELLRTPLEEMCLQCKKLNLAPGGPDDSDGIPAFLSKAMDPPHPKSITNALELLVDLGAMQPETNNLTNLGQCLSILSLEPRVGKMVIWSYLLGCARVASSMGVAMSYKNPFVLPPSSLRRQADMAKVLLSENKESDQITVLNALRKRDQLVKRQGVYNDFCRRSFLSYSTLEMISELRRNLTRELMSLGFPNPAAPNQYHNRHDNDHALWQAAIAAGLYPNVASRRRGQVNFSTMTNRKAKMHVSSVNAVKGQPLNAKCQLPRGEVEFVAFGEMVRGPSVFTMNQTTHLASPLPLLLLCGTSLSVRPKSEDAKVSILSVDDWIIFESDADTAACIVVLRKRLEAAFWRAISNPASGLSALSEAERDAVEILGPLLQSAHRLAPDRT